MIDPLIKILKKKVGGDTEILYDVDDLKVSMIDIGAAPPSIISLRGTQTPWGW